MEHLSRAAGTHSSHGKVRFVQGWRWGRGRRGGQEGREGHVAKRCNKTGGEWVGPHGQEGTGDGCWAGRSREHGAGPQVASQGAPTMGAGMGANMAREGGAQTGSIAGYQQHPWNM